MTKLPKAERQMLACARQAFTRLVGLPKADEMMDELVDARTKRYENDQR